MTLTNLTRPAAVAMALSGLLWVGDLSAQRATETRISKPGEYAGYSPVLYDGNERTSFYVPMRDGVRLAMDLFRPTRRGALTDERLPVVWMHTPYNRRTYGGGPAVQNYPGYAIRLAEYGYNVAVVDFRGLYASQGTNGAYNRGEWLEAARMDAYDVTEWLAKQPWSNGRIGMWGCSATGGSQMQAATTRPPSLKAIFPMSCEFDAYSFAVAGGIARAAGPTSTPPNAQQTTMPNAASAARDARAVPVDGAQGQALLTEAIAQHRTNVENAGFVPFRDSRSSNLGGVQWWLLSSPHAYFDALRSSGIGIYAAANWDEAGTKHGAFFTFKNLESQAKLIVGPAGHCDWDVVQRDTGFDIVIEELRFFDYWLKGVANGVMDEPRVTYYTYHAADGNGWRTARTWPLPNEQRTRFYLTDNGLGNSRPTGSEQDGALTGAAPSITSTMIRVSQVGVSYQTPPLPADVEVTGHPVLNLWISSDAPDLDVVAVLEDVAPDGTTQTYNMSGQLRASRRALAQPPYNNLGLPWRTHAEADARPLRSGEPAELVFDLLPISYNFQKGHRIRIALSFSDPAASSGRSVTVYRSADHSSFLTLPVIPRGN